MVFSGFICFSLIFFLYQKIKTSPEFSEILQNQTLLFIAISGFTAFILLGYIVLSIFGMKRIILSGDNQLSDLVKKMNLVRKIIEIIIESKLWLPGVKDFIDMEFEGLNFFEVKEFYKGKSKLAIEFLQEKKAYHETETLYLELKSLLYTEPKQKKTTSDIEYPEQYKIEILEKWLEHKVGSGLWYYFGYKFGDYKDSLDIDAVYERHQDKIMTLANDINSELFEDSSFNEVFLSKLGEYINKDLLPKLFQAQNKIKSGLSKSLQYIYMLFASLVLIGVVIPLLCILFQLPSIALICSFSFVISILFFVLVAALPFLSESANN
jgi:hypothetical protein